MPETTDTTATPTTTTTAAPAPDQKISFAIPNNNIVINTKYLDDNTFDMVVKFGPQLPMIARYAMVSLSLDGPRLPVLLSCRCPLCIDKLACDVPCTVGIPRDVDFDAETVFRLPRHPFEPNFYEHIVLALNHDHILAKYADHHLWHSTPINLNDHVYKVPEWYNRKRN